MFQRVSIAFAILVAVIATAAFAENEKKLPPLDKAAADKVSFRRDVWPIVKRHCWGCHSGGDPKGGLSMDSVDDMLKGGDSGPLFAAGKPDDSLLVEAIAGDEPEMPQKQPPLSVAKIHVFRQWILAGARDDSAPGSGQPVILIPKTYRYAPAVTSVSLSSDGKWLAAACRSEVVLIDVDGQAPPRRLPTDCDLLSHVEFSPDGKILAAAGGSPTRYGEVRFFDAKSGRVISSRRVGHETLFRGNFSPDSQAIALGGTDGAVHIVPVNPKAPIRRFEMHSDWVLDVAYTPDGKMVVTGSRDKTTKVSSVETGKLLRSIDSSAELIGSVASNGLFAISAGRARTLFGYEYKIALSGVEVAGSGNSSRPVSKRNQYAKAFETQPGEVFDVASSGDRKFLAVAGAFGDVRVYQTADRKRTTLIPNVPAPVYSVALDRDGRRLALGTKSGQVQIYELPSGKLLKSLVPVPVDAAKTNVATK